MTYATPWGFQTHEEGGTPFGHKDYTRARAFGATDLEIKSWLDKNKNALSIHNQAGGKFGLYDLVTNRARAAETKAGEEAQYRQDMMDLQQSQTDTVQQQARDEAEYQRQMLAEQKKVKHSTPMHVKQPGAPLTIGPGKASAPQSASSLARSPRTGAIVSGLNIGGVSTSMKNKFRNKTPAKAMTAGIK